MIGFFDLIRLNKPIGTLLLLLPCLFGLFLSGQNLAFLDMAKFILLFSVGAFLMRSAGCIINDIFDRKFDAQVARTKSRPLASGAISLEQAVIFLVILLFLALLILLEFNFVTRAAGVVALMLVALYPLMKRITFYPQIFLGITFNYGILIADLAVNKTISNTSWVLFLACIIWTLIYDTIYAFQDLEDDLKIGIKSATMRFSSNPKLIFSTLAIAMFGLIFYVGSLCKFSHNFFGIIFLAFCYLLFLILRCDYANQEQCLQAFKNNIIVGFLILAAIIVA